MRLLKLSVPTLLAAVLASGCQTQPAAVAPATAVAPVTTVAPSKELAMPTERASMIAPLVEKRETLVATGYSVISVQNHKVPSQQRLMAIRAAKLDAYRSLTEQVYGQYLDASTTVADMVVMSDTFRARVEGVIYGAILVSITPINDDTYEATMSLDRAVVNDLRLLYLGRIAAKKK